MVTSNTNNGFDDKFIYVVKLVDDVNKKIIGEDWKSKKLLWQYTIMTETTELVESLGFAWWKHSNTNIKDVSYKELLSNSKYDRDNVLIELADLLVFQISYELSKGKKNIGGLTVMDEALHYDNIADQKLDIFVAAKENIEYMSMDSLSTLISMCGFSADDVLDAVVIKSALNNLRTSYGYKEGKYKKQWCYNGLEYEDNKVVNMLLKDVKVPDAYSVYKIIEDYYINTVLNQ